MSPSPVFGTYLSFAIPAPAPTRASAALATDSSGHSLLALSSLDAALARPLALAVGTALFVGLVGAALLAGSGAATRAISDEIIARADRSFAVGFLAFFGLLVVSSIPLVIATFVEQAAVSGLALLSVPGLLVWGLLLLAGSCVGAVAVGEWIDRRLRRRGESGPASGFTSTSTPPSSDPPPARAVAIGALVLGGSQLVPVLGALVAMGLATVAIGAVLRRQFDVDNRLFGSERAARDGAADWSRDRDSSATEVWRSSEERASAEASGGRAGTEAVTEPPRSVSGDESAGDGWSLAIEEAGSDHDRDLEAESAADADRTAVDVDAFEDDSGPADEEWTVEDWEWGTESDRDEESS